jgi:hypothetical protein
MLAQMHIQELQRARFLSQDNIAETFCDIMEPKTYLGHQLAYRPAQAEPN